MCKVRDYLLLALIDNRNNSDFVQLTKWVDWRLLKDTRSVWRGVRLFLNLFAEASRTCHGWHEICGLFMQANLPKISLAQHKQTVIRH